MRPEELEACAALGGTDWLADVVRGIWTDGHSSPDQSFVAEEQGRPVGRAFFHHVADPKELAMFGNYVDQSVDFLETGRALLGTALARLRETGATGVEHAIYDIYDPNPVRQQELIESVGFGQYQEKKRYVWQDLGVEVEVRARLDYRTLASVVGRCWPDRKCRWSVPVSAVLTATARLDWRSTGCCRILRTCGRRRCGE